MFAISDAILRFLPGVILFLPKEHDLAFLLVQVYGLDPQLLFNCKFCSLFFFLASASNPLFWHSSDNAALPVAFVMSDEKLAVTHSSVALYVRALLFCGCWQKISRCFSAV